MVASAAQPLIVAACSPGAAEVLSGVLCGAARLVPAGSEHEALRMIEELAAPDLLVCSLRFDESRMLELVAHAAVSRPGLPCVCCRLATRGRIGEASLRAAFTAARQLGAAACFDLLALERDLGRCAARDRLREAMLALAHDGRHLAGTPA